MGCRAAHSRGGTACHVTPLGWVLKATAFGHTQHLWCTLRAHHAICNKAPLGVAEGCSISMLLLLPPSTQGPAGPGAASPVQLARQRPVNVAQVRLADGSPTYRCLAIAARTRLQAALESPTLSGWAEERPRPARLQC